MISTQELSNLIKPIILNQDIISSDPDQSTETDFNWFSLYEKALNGTPIYIKSLDITSYASSEQITAKYSLIELKPLNRIMKNGKLTRGFIGKCLDIIDPSGYIKSEYICISFERKEDNKIYQTIYLTNPW